MKPLLRVLILMLALLLLANPAPAAAQTSDYDWCFSWDLRPQNPFTVMGGDGFWFQGVGYRSSNTFELDLHYNHDQNVEPLMVVLRFLNTQETPKSLSLTGNAFSISLDRALTMSSGNNQLVFYRDPGSLTTGSSVMDITASGEHYYDLWLVAIFGNGPNPFPANSCFGPQQESQSDNLLEALETANAALESANTDLGVAALPFDAAVFAYAKWMVSTVAADELFGPFAPIVVHAGVAVGILTIGFTIYGTIYVVAVIIRFVVFIIKNWQTAIAVMIVVLIMLAVFSILNIAGVLVDAARSVIDFLINLTGGS